MPQDYDITNPNFRNSPLNGTANNYIPFRPTNTLNSIVGPLFRIPTPTVSQILLDNLPLYQIKPIVDEPDKPAYFSKLGTPVMDGLILIGLNQDVIDFLPVDNVEETADGFTRWRLNDVIIMVDQPKKIVTTEIAGNNGTIKEFIGLGDYEITINGRLTGSYNKRPKEELRNLKLFLDLNKTIGVHSDYLLDLGIKEIVVTTYSLPQIEGNYSTQFFTINAVSDLRPENKFLIHTKPTTPASPFLI